MQGIPEVVGWVAVVLTQVFYVPATLWVRRMRNVAGYSLTAWLMLTLGLGCYLFYFAAKGDVVGIVANACGVFGSGLTTACILFWRNRPVPVAEN